MFNEENKAVRYTPFSNYNHIPNGELSNSNSHQFITMGNCGGGGGSNGTKNSSVNNTTMPNTTDLTNVETEIEIEVVLVGDSMCGKSALAMRFVCDIFNEVYTPTNFDKQSVSTQVGQIPIRFNIWDTSGSSAHDSVRPLAYSEAKVFLVCFDIGDPTSLDHVVTKWFREIRTHCDKTPVILCGCRSDLRNNVEVLSALAQMKQIPVTSEQALQVSRIVGACTYVETSAISPGSQCIRDAFEVAALAAIGKLNSNGFDKRSPFRSSKSIKKLVTKSPGHNLKFADTKSSKIHSGQKCCIV